ncbi:hypothetical protein BVRB_014720 [Beta vulgaris subsp. vulgaris]|uniref:Uncharacterized protein n=1 Tax=Beta vulgaris subsp. vulgaris TaxID=3555 RepID=A0A0J8DVH3_BETVV|nr:hypothetical protein BVRB_014720 [Beta vulgaris subsp. vulgaris]
MACFWSLCFLLFIKVVVFVFASSQAMVDDDPESSL